MLQLGAGEPGLDLAVAAGAGLGEPLLPAPPARAGTPDEQLASAQHVGGRLHEPFTRVVERGDPAALPVGYFVEVVGGEVGARRTGAVDALVLGYRHPAQPPLVAEVPGLVRRDQHPAPLGDGDVGPPVHGGGLLVRVADADADVQEVGAVRQPQVDLEGQVAQPFPLPQAEHLTAVGGRYPGRVDGCAGQGRVAGRADVPLDAAGEPGAVEGEAGGLEHRVAVQEFALRGLVEEGGDTTSAGRQYGDPQAVVLDHDRVGRAGRAVSVVAVPEALRQDVAQGFVADLPGHVPGESFTVPVVDAMRLVERPQGRQGVAGAQLR